MNKTYADIEKKIVSLVETQKEEAAKIQSKIDNVEEELRIIENRINETAEAEDLNGYSKAIKERENILAKYDMYQIKLSKINSFDNSEFEKRLPGMISKCHDEVINNLIKKTAPLFREICKQLEDAQDDIQYGYSLLETYNRAYGTTFNTYGYVDITGTLGYISRTVSHMPNTLK